MNSRYQIGIIGAGNMAHFLGRRLVGTAMPVAAVFSRNKNEGMQLAQRIDAVYCASLEELATHCSYLLICTSDDSIEDIARQLAAFPDRTLIHHSGTKPLSAVQKTHERAGVLWPVYSIHKRQIPEHRNIPFVLTAQHLDVVQFLSKLADELSNLHQFMTDEKKRVLHLMAVLSNNFMTHLAYIAQQVGRKEDIPFDWIQPIIEQTTSYFSADDISTMQTGPAIRRDDTTLHTHEILLEAHPDWLEIYKLITKSIQNQSKK